MRGREGDSLTSLGDSEGHKVHARVIWNRGVMQNTYNFG